MLKVILLCLALSLAPARANADAGDAAKLVGSVLVGVGVFTNNPTLVKVGYGMLIGGDAFGSKASACFIRRRRRVEARERTGRSAEVAR